MKLAFSSLGMPGAGIDELIRCAEEGKADGLELRIADGEAITKTMPAKAQQTARRRIEGAGLTLIAISSYIKICSPEPDADVIRDLHETLELAAALGAGGVRIFPGADPGNGKAKDWDGLAARRLSAAAEVASSLDVQLLLETHDSHPTGTDIARILRRVEPSGATKAIWDVLHPWRHGEQPEDTANALRGSLAYCQFKDAIIGAGPDSVTLTLPGQGAIPMAAIAGTAEKISKDQGDKTFWACLEWEKAWHPHLEELPEALTALRAILMPKAAA
ncbi:sugar phosphate isomerase/epimerase [Pseudarthrobacter sp. NamE5]|uniref:sugar phosphate isomerase/epimerase family protein n=1 Tax=Pseudarthrobacter sp. NamE5 TaxID=2576839 RepID=UPI00110BAEBD|nr:TIM barrel protein [Pseudarthrobacter sp. NamE5]TLM83466.1 TIM barrel protein [Pseudarthrobacter sp. NamE5]